MALPCGVNLNLNNLKGDIESRVGAILNINIGTPAGLAEIAGKIEGELSAIKDKVAAVIVVPPVLKTLRDELGELAALPFAGLAAAAKIVSIAADYAGITNLRGFANLNLTDLAKSVFSISGTFDPCNAKLPDFGSIPNIALDPSGILQKLPTVQPLLASTLAAVDIKEIQKVTNNVTESFKDNVEILASDPRVTSLKKIATNISTVQIDPPPPAPTFTPSTGTNAWGLTDGEIPKNMQNWTAKDVNDYLLEIRRLGNAGILRKGAIQRALAVQKFHAESHRLYQNARTEKWRTENPDFDNPSSPNYRMFENKILLKEGTNEHNGKFQWQRG